MNLRFTVVTVAVNAEKAIRKTIESVLNQTYAPYEYLIIDGKSTDQTLAIAQEYAEAFKHKGVFYHIVSEKDTGIYNAMNKGIKMAKGNFLSFLNAGDWYERDALESMNAFYKEDPFELAYGGLHYIKPDGRVIHKMSKNDEKGIVTSRHWNHPSMFLKREIYQKFGFDESFPAYADFDLYLKLRKNGTKIRVIDKVITNFIADGVSTNADFKKVMARSKEKYTAYRQNGYSALYWIESYGWELLKVAYLSIRK